MRFTFHNVSINSPDDESIVIATNEFTFHNVSINSREKIAIKAGLELFTFHNVSINSEEKSAGIYTIFNLHSTMFLLIPPVRCNRSQRIFIYIPQCFY